MIPQLDPLTNVNCWYLPVKNIKLAWYVETNGGLAWFKIGETPNPSNLIAHPHLLVRTASERFLQVGVTFRVGLASDHESHWM